MSSKQRSLKNLKLTKEWHFRYLGLWVLITFSLMVTTNIVLFLWIQEHFMDVLSSVDAGHTIYIEFKNWLILGLLVETVLFGVAVTAMAKLTAHRIAGPYIRLHKVFEAIAAGDTSVRLKFRTYDNLDNLAKAFNDMMDRLSKPGAR